MYQYAVEAEADLRALAVRAEGNFARWHHQPEFTVRADCKDEKNEAGIDGVSVISCEALSNPAD